MPTVPFIPGLESGPQGQKSRALSEAGFKVAAVQMPSSQRAILRDPLVVAVGVALVASLAMAAMAGLLPFVATALVSALAMTTARPLITRRMWHRSLAVQRHALAENAIDVVVGSSFGGAIALELVSREEWKGPTVLLCPAQRLLANRARLTPTTLPPTRAQVLVVHGRQDEVVPIEHSRQLTTGTLARLLEVDDDHRLTTTATAANFRVWVEAAQQLPSRP